MSRINAVTAPIARAFQHVEQRGRIGFRITAAQIVRLAAGQPYVFRRDRKSVV